MKRRRYPKYHIDVFFSEDDEGWIANIPDINCSAFGDSPVEAVQEVMMALTGRIECAKDRGLPLPEPQYRSSVS